MRFLPEAHTDFIFASYAEETGFMGVVFALILYFILLMKIVNNAQTAPDAAECTCAWEWPRCCFFTFSSISAWSSTRCP
ncbi:MAG: FtsW/RodA/SpoVE family cell cycle protein [Bryobacterales bacterium]